MISKELRQLMDELDSVESTIDSLNLGNNTNLNFEDLVYVRNHITYTKDFLEELTQNLTYNLI